MERLKGKPFFFTGGFKQLRGGWNGAHVNIWWCPNDKPTKAAMMLHTTGPWRLNAIMRGRAKELGFKLSQWGLFDGDEPLNLTSEKAIFSALGHTWREPQERQRDFG
jgi:DNA polymerase (family 10)